MRHLMMLVALALAAAGAGAADFTQTLSAEERAATGLDKLTAGELARLKAVVERYKSGEVTAAQQAAEERMAQAEQAARERVVAAEAKAQTAAPGERKQPGWLGALITLRKAESKPDEAEEVKSRLAGPLKTFQGRRTFALENGQVWQMVEPGSYYGPVLENPRVTVRPGLMAAFWLKVPDAGLRVQVKPLKLE